MQTNNEVYSKYVDKKTPNSRHLITMLYAFLMGGFICVIGQSVMESIKAIWINMPKHELFAWTAAVMIFIGATLTGLGIYSKIGSWAGAGSLIPITGFANSVVSPAIEFKTEGYIYGLSAKMFVIAGPIIVYGVLSSVFVGFIYSIIYAV